MARKLRVVYEGAIYHVINRGNYRANVFECEGSARAFEETLFEAVEGSGWQLHGYVVMSNHYHLAVTTPQANLVEGMHWLQATFATRFNRFRGEQGHLFQGRYKAQLVQPGEALWRVVNYIHLNPVRARVLEASAVADYQWSSLRRFLGKAERRNGMDARPWLNVSGRTDTEADWRSYLDWLIRVGGSDIEQKSEGLVDLGLGWAIGTHSWRQALAEEHTQLAVEPGIAKQEVREMQEARWQLFLAEELKLMAKKPVDIQTDRKGAPWKVELAMKLKSKALVPNAWLAEQLRMGNPQAVSSYVSQAKKQKM